MECQHPWCPAGAGAGTWTDVLQHASIKLDAAKKKILLAALEKDFAVPPTAVPARKPLPVLPAGVARSLLRLCPCLFNQADIKCSPRGVVHLCELTLGAPITDASVHAAFLIQHPKKGPPYLYPPAQPCSDGGAIMEMLCSEVLAAAGIAPMSLDNDGWPQWQMPGHILLNEGKMGALRAFGDILVPCGPTNLIISVKSEAARERLLYSSNAIEGIGFGFFDQPEEFWSESRMNLYKRMGFSAIYLPDGTHAEIAARLHSKGLEVKAVNVNGTALYRPLTTFGRDMQRVIGRHSLLL